MVLARDVHGEGACTWVVVILVSVIVGMWVLSVRSEAPDLRLGLDAEEMRGSYVWTGVSIRQYRILGTLSVVAA
jgi:hypothetical protein